MKPRAHNLISYSFALAIFVATLLARMAFGASSLAALQPAALAGALMWCVHFARRASESAWVHRYAKPSVPTGDVVTEYIYYWGFAAWNAVSLTSASYREPALWLVALGSVVFVL